MGVITSWNFLDPYVYQNVDIMGNIILLCSSMKLDIVSELWRTLKLSNFTNYRFHGRTEIRSSRKALML